MSRTYANFLLFEDVLDNIPVTSPIMTQAVQTLLSPIVNIVEEDCNTLLGNIVDTSMELEGLIEIATGDPLTPTRITTLLSEGQYRIGVRNMHSCISHTKGGVCRACYHGSFLGETCAQVGAKLQVMSSLIYQSDVIIGDNYSVKFPLSQTSDDWYSVKVIHNGLLVDPTNYTIGFDFIEFPMTLAVGQIYTVHFYQENTEPFEGFIARTYTGGLLGIQPLPTLKTLIREQLYEGQFSDSYIALMMEVIKPLRVIPSTYFDYLDRIHTRLEKVLLILYLFAIYSNVEL